MIHAIITCRAFSKPFSPLNHSEYTTLEYNTVITVTGMKIRRKKQIALNATECHGFGQFSMQKSDALSYFTVKNSGVSRIPAAIHMAGITICRHNVTT